MFRSDIVTETATALGPMPPVSPALAPISASSGAPAIAPHGPREILGPGHALVPVGNPALLAEAILEAFEQPIDRAALRRRAADFTTERTVEAFAAGRHEAQARRHSHARDHHMIDWTDPLASASRRLARAVPFRPFRMALEQPVVSFTFDDFPLSAARNAAPLLEANAARGTFYFAHGLAGGFENGQLIAGQDVAANLATNRHEVGGHTSDHINVQRVAPDHLIADVAANTSAIAALSGQAPTSFAYPFGVVSLNAKRLLAPRFAGLRGIQPGINRGWIDLAHLHAHELYDVSSSLDGIGQLLDGLQRHGGWLIFYTHDVRPDPSPIGCSPKRFGAVLDMVGRRGLAIATVAETLRQIGARPAS